MKHISKGNFNPWSPGVENNIGLLCTIYVPPGLKGLRAHKVDELSSKEPVSNSTLMVSTPWMDVFCQTLEDHMYDLALS